MVGLGVARESYQWRRRWHSGQAVRRGRGKTPAASAANHKW